MKTRLLAAVVPVVLLAGCSAGPSYLRRSVDDYQNKHYETDPLVTGVLSDVVPVYPIAYFLGTVGDWIVLNPVQFWGWDVWKGEGASFTHENPERTHSTWFLKDE